jgi:hypothetical protein
MEYLAKYSLRLRYEGGSAVDGLIDLYDGSASIHGFSQALQIVTHAYVSGKIVQKAPALKGARMYLTPLKRGSVVVEVVAFVEKYPATFAIAAPVFYDFIKFAFAKATGRFKVKPETPAVKKQFERDEPFFDELAETLEGSLQRGHRIIGDGVTKIELERPRLPLISFDRKSKDWVNTREENPRLRKMHGNVTRFNSLSRNGRAYIKEIGKVVPFRPDGDFPSSKLGLLTWSLHGSNVDHQNQLTLSVKEIKSARGDVKRLLLSDCYRTETDED